MSAVLRSRLDSFESAPKTLLIATVLAALTTPAQHSLLLHTISWTVLSGICAFKTKSILQERPGRRLAYSAGFLLALRQICEQAVGAENLYWAQGLLPLAFYAARFADVLPSNEEHGNIHITPSWAGLAGLTICGLSASYHRQAESLAALGLSYIVLSVVALLLLERAFADTASSLLAQSPNVLATLRDVSLGAGSVCFITAIAWESWRFDGLAQWGLFGRILGDSWIPGQTVLNLIQAVLAIVFQIVLITALTSTVHREKAFPTSFVIFAAYILATVLLRPTYSTVWFGALTGLYLYATHKDLSRYRPFKVLAVVLVVSLLWTLQPESISLHSVDTLKPLPATTHPMAQLIGDAQAAWSHTVNGQSRTLNAAVAEYKRRYGMSPPPNFDKWFDFAMARDVKIIDEYDTIYHSLLPFWGLSPATIRARARESIGHKANNLLGLLIRDGKIVHVENADDWQQRATVGMIEKYVQYLPDMDLAFNIHDEPRVVVPAGGLEQLVLAGQAEIAAAKAEKSFTKSPDLNDGRRIDEVKFTRFNSFPHQATWSPSIISCPVDSPVGSYRETTDNLTAYAIGELGFVYNHTAFTDICNSPSLRDTYGFFERANAYNVVHDLYPVFSQSKLSSFQDIVYPSVWYWYDKTVYHELMDPSWEKKEGILYWRGSTTGGYSQDGGWRKQHRQQIVRKLAQVADVRFSNVKQCDEADCAAQKEFFQIAGKSDQQDAWKYKYLLDMDGNAYSGRFYAFLKSHSLVFKMAVFREWHEEWIKPWVHYIPLSLKMDEAMEAVKWINESDEGERMASESSQWARATLRKDDYEVWMFRLLLEYGRVVDDERLSVGFV